MDSSSSKAKPQQNANMGLLFDAIDRVTISVLVVIIVTAIIVLRWLYNCNMRTAKFPPGAPTLPVLGNLHQMPRKHPFLKYTVSRQYSTRFALTEPDFLVGVVERIWRYNRLETWFSEHDHLEQSRSGSESFHSTSKYILWPTRALHDSDSLYPGFRARSRITS